MLGLMQVLGEIDAIYTPVMRKGQSEAVRVGEVAERFGGTLTQILQHDCSDVLEFWSRCKRAAILWDWIQGTSVEIMVYRFSTTPFRGSIEYGDIIRIADVTRFHLRSAYQILSTLFPDQSEYMMALDELIRRLEFGLPSAAIPLIEIPLALDRGEYLALYQAGCTTADDVKCLNLDKLTECIRPSMASLLRKEPIE